MSTAVAADANNMRLLNHWSEANHESMIGGTNDDNGAHTDDLSEVWLNLYWSQRVLKVPASAISRLPTVSSYPDTLQFRVWIRLVAVDVDDATDTAMRHQTSSWLTSSSTAVSSAFDFMDITIQAKPSQGSCEFVPQSIIETEKLIAHETPLLVKLVLGLARSIIGL